MDVDQQSRRIRIVDPEYECKAIVYSDMLRKTCDLIPDPSLREMCYLSTNTDRVIFLDANTLEPMDREDIRIYGELYCFPKTQEVYAVMFVSTGLRQGKKIEYVLLTKIYGNMVESRIVLLKHTPNIYVIMRKEGTRRMLRDDLEKVLDKISKMDHMIKTPLREYVVSSLYK